MKNTKIQTNQTNQSIESESTKEQNKFNETFPNAVFRKSSSSGQFDGNSNCVEVAFVQNAIGVRDSKNRHHSTLQFTRSEWIAFIEGVKAGEFDLK